MCWCAARILHPLNSGAAASPMSLFIHDLAQVSQSTFILHQFWWLSLPLILPAVSFGEGNDQGLGVQSKSGGAATIDRDRNVTDTHWRSRGNKPCSLTSSLFYWVFKFPVLTDMIGQAHWPMIQLYLCFIEVGWGLLTGFESDLLHLELGWSSWYL